jgi:lysophospholipase L1-like esterase
MPNTLNPSVWWIEIGSNDLMKGQCAEEAVLLGILHLAEYISTQKPGAMIVINSILPQQAKVEPRNKHVGKFKPFEIMPSIQLINEQLDKFCKKHTQFKFFDATSLFFMSTPPKLADMKKNKKLRMPPLNPQLMDPTNKLTTEGYKQWGDAIAAEVKRIVYDEMYDEASELGFLDDMFTDDFSY